MSTFHTDKIQAGLDAINGRVPEGPGPQATDFSLAYTKDLDAAEAAQIGAGLASWMDTEIAGYAKLRENYVRLLDSQFDSSMPDEKEMRARKLAEFDKEKLHLFETGPDANATEDDTRSRTVRRYHEAMLLIRKIRATRELYPSVVARFAVCFNPADSQLAAWRDQVSVQGEAGLTTLARHSIAAKDPRLGAAVIERLQGMNSEQRKTLARQGVSVQALAEAHGGQAYAAFIKNLDDAEAQARRVINLWQNRSRSFGDESSHEKLKRGIIAATAS